MKKNALISVSNKEGIVEFAKGLIDSGYHILSTGGTAKKLRESNVAVTEISQYTKFPEMMDGRVKTLHPKIFGGILALRNNKEHMQQAKYNDIEQIDIVVVNLYPFEETVARNASFEEAIENIDIGGPSLLRAAAKSYQDIKVVVDPADYGKVLKSIKGSDNEINKKLALKVFEHTARYDSIINNYFMEKFNGKEFPETLNLTFKKKQDLRYGENPHQEAAFYLDPIAFESSVSTAKQLHGKELSFNNILDTDNAFELVKEYKEPAAAIIKHTNPCGCAIADNIEEAFDNAYEGDKLSAFGGVVALNRPCTKEVAQKISEFFVEIVICPKFEKEALDVLMKKKNLRLLETKDAEKSGKSIEARKVVGGLLVQRGPLPEISEKDLKIVSKRKPTKDEVKQMLFAYKTCYHTKSNSIIFAKNNSAVGIGAGQQSRVVSVKIASEKAGSKAKGAVMASDAFFPFRDGVDEAAKAGITAIIHPGGSVRDEEVIKAADEHDIAMVTTGVRLFWH